MEELALIFKSLADEARLRILNLLLTSEELCVCDIESTLGFTQTKVSRHMIYLKRAGLIEDRKLGRWVLYRLSEPCNEHQRIILDVVKGILQSHAKTQKDAQRLEKSINNGCCATTTVLNA